MLEIKNLSVSVGRKQIIKDANIKIPDNEVVVLFGPNGCGKSTLFGTIVGFSKYRVNSGKILFNDIDITEKPIEERNKLGISVVLQSPPAIKGISLKTLVSANGYNFGKLLSELSVENLIDRDVNLGLSGGEVKRSEVFQMVLNKRAEFYLLDEPDSGVDPENLDKIGRVIDKTIHKKGKSALVVTHSGEILNYINADIAYVMIDGEVKCGGDPKKVLGRIKKEGYSRCFTCKGDLINE